jgi:hypothetical protein
MNSDVVRSPWLKGVLVVCFLLLLVEMASGLLFTFPGYDGSYYLSYTRYVTRGLRPYEDFPSPYPPGAYYVQALVGEAGVSDPLLSKVPMYLAQILNAVLFAGILGSFGLRRWDVVLYTVLFCVWVMATGGTLVLLEPFQNTFLLLSFLILLRWRSPAACALAGISCGAALMMKQLSLPGVPGLLLLALAPAVSVDDAERRSWPARLGGSALFLVCLGVPFTAFVVANGLDFIETFRAVTTFGGGVGGYASFNWRSAFDLFLTRPQLALLPAFPCFVLGAWLLWEDRTWENASLVALFSAFILMLFMMFHAHYVQLVAPWGCLIVARYFQQVVARSEQLRGGLALGFALIALWFVPAILVSARTAGQEIKNRPAPAYQAMADELAAHLGSHKDVLAINGPWLYYLADITPPELDHGFVRPKDLEGPWCKKLIAKSSHVVVLPFGHAGKYPMQQTKEFLEREGFEYYDSVPVDVSVLGDDVPPKKEPAYLFRRPNKQTSKGPTNGRN